MIPVYSPSIGAREKEYVLDCLETGWISSRGGYVDRFEHAFCDFTGGEHATSVNNGTTALHLVMAALGLGPGDEVIVPTFTYVASVNAMSFVGATPVFVDSDPASWQMDVKAVEAAITPQTKAIMAVHLYGQPADMIAICTLAKAHGLKVIEDAAEGFGSKIGDQHVGTFGDVGTFSFFGNKTITTGEGGMVTARDAQLMAEMRLLKSQYVSPTKQYWHEKVGFNFRMTNICAAIGLAQLERANDTLARKRAIANLYQSILAQAGIETHREQSGTTHSFWMCSALLPKDVDRAKLMAFLSDAGIETRPGFYPVHTMPMHANWPSSKLQFKNAAELGARILNLPSWPGLSDEQVESVAQSLVQGCEVQKGRKMGEGRP